MNPAPDQPPSSSTPSTVAHSAPLNPTVPISTNTNQPLINNIPKNNVNTAPIPSSISNPPAPSSAIHPPPTYIPQVTSTQVSPSTTASIPPSMPPANNLPIQNLQPTTVPTTANNSHPPTNKSPMQPTTNNQQPTTAPSPYTSFQPSTASHHPRKFPFMMVTFFLVLIIAGFTGSFLFFSYSKASEKKTPVQILITPPVTLAPSITLAPSPTPNLNPFASSSADLVNPFASPTATLVNPFSSFQNPFNIDTSTSSSSQTYQNPFAVATSSSDSTQPYENPFEKLK